MKIVSKIKAFLSNKLQYNKEELLVKQIIEKMMSHPDTKFRFSPLSQDLLLKNTKNDYYILISNVRIKICNHSFIVDETYRLSFIEDMRKILYDKIERDRNESISEIFENRTNLLSNIINNL